MPNYVSESWRFFMEIDVYFKNTRTKITVDLKITSKRNRKKRKKLTEAIMKYAISAATGSFGQTAVKNLVDAVGAENVVAIVRNEEKGKRLLPARIEIR